MLFLPLHFLKILWSRVHIPCICSVGSSAQGLTVHHMVLPGYNFPLYLHRPKIPITPSKVELLKCKTTLLNGYPRVPAPYMDPTHGFYGYLWVLTRILDPTRGAQGFPRVSQKMSRGIEKKKRLRYTFYLLPFLFTFSLLFLLSPSTSSFYPLSLLSLFFFYLLLSLYFFFVFN